MPYSPRPLFDLSAFADLPVSSRQPTVRPGPTARLPARSLLTSRRKPAAALAPADALTTLVFFGFERQTAQACEAIAAELGLVAVTARDLHLACKAMDRTGRVIVFGSGSMPPWDRHVVNERAAVARIAVHWFDRAVSDAAEEVRARLGAALRPTRR